MRKVFDVTRIKDMTLENRLIRSATWEGMCEDDGKPTAKLAEYYRNLAYNRVGLIISGYTYVRPEGKQLRGMMGLCDNRAAVEMRSLAEAVHAEGGKIAMQLVHAGGQTNSAMIGQRPLAPSAIKAPQFQEEPAELSSGDIKSIINAFAQASAKAREYGFDGVQLHAAHGYLVNQFLSPLTNRRTDDYGGDAERRRHFLMEIYRAMRRAVGDDFPILVKLNGADNQEGGLQAEESLSAAKALDDEGIDAIEVSGGTPASGAETPVRQGIDSREKEAYNLPLAARIKSGVTCPVIVVGGLRSFEIVEGIIRREEADYVSMARPFIREPHLARRWQEGDERRATCISCNGCFKPGLKEGGIYCVVDKIEQESSKESL